MNRDEWLVNKFSHSPGMSIIIPLNLNVKDFKAKATMCDSMVWINFKLDI